MKSFLVSFDLNNLFPSILLLLLLAHRYFFDVCDGIFVNYTWQEKNLATTLGNAQHRVMDVFVGVDVFGRNTYGGGQFNAHKVSIIVDLYNGALKRKFNYRLLKKSASMASPWRYLLRAGLTKLYLKNLLIHFWNDFSTGTMHFGKVYGRICTHIP